MAGEEERRLQLEAKQHEQTPQALARLVVVVLFVGVWLLLWLLRIPMPVPFLFTLVVEVAFFLLYWRLVFRLPNVRAVQLANYGMLAAEIVFHTTMVYFLGGISWLGAFAYVFGLVFTNTFLDLRRGFVYTLGAASAFVSMALLDAKGVIPHQYYLEGGPLRFTEGRFLVTTIIGAAGVFFSLYAWVNWVGHQLRQERDTAVRAQDGLLRFQGELRRANFDLEERVRTRTGELELLNRMLSESEQRLRTVVSNAPVVLFALDQEGMFTLCEGRGLADLGVDPQSVVGRSVFEVFEGQTDVLTTVRRALEGEELTTVARPGDSVFEARLVPLRSAYGALVGVIGVATDITERMRVEAEREKLVSLVEHSSDFIGIASLDGGVLYLNAAGQKLVGLAPDAVTKTKIYDYYFPEDLAELRERILPAFFEAGYWEGELRFRHFKTEQAIAVHVTRFLIRSPESDEPIAMATVTRDITDRKRAEVALRESEAKFRTMAETVAAAAFIFQDTRIRYVNSTAEAMTGYHRNELLAMNFWDVIHADFQELVQERGLGHQRGEEIPTRYEVKIVTKNGEERWVDFTAGRIEYEGHPAVLGTAFDITERKRAEDALAEQARRDPLTGILNRRAGLAAIEAVLDEQKEAGGALAVLVVDVDTFKRINDTFGHEAGDEALLRLTDLLVAAVGEGGVVFRLGGDEFEIALKGAGLDDALAFAEKVRWSLHRAQAAGSGPQFTLGVGIACFPGDGDSLAELGRHADEAMYAAKAAGGDTCRAWRHLGQRAA